MSMPEKLLHLRYKPKKPHFKHCSPCPAFELFDWVIWNPDVRYPLRLKTAHPKYILCLAHSRSLKILIHFRFLLEDVVLVIAGEDTNLSNIEHLVKTIQPYCKKVLYEAKDVEMNGVSSFSMGFTSYYLKRPQKGLINELRNKVAQPSWRKEGILAAWGEIWKHLDDLLEDRKNLIRFVENCDWISRESLKANRYWERLAESEFLIAPAGNGIQAPKLAEAWLMHTVPIVTSNPCFRDLHSAGYPLLILNTWEDLTPSALKEYQTNYLPQIHWEKIEHMLTLNYFEDLIKS